MIFAKLDDYKLTLITEYFHLGKMQGRYLRTRFELEWIASFCRVYDWNKRLLDENQVGRWKKGDQSNGTCLNAGDIAFIFSVFDRFVILLLKTKYHSDNHDSKLSSIRPLIFSYVSFNHVLKNGCNDTPTFDNS